MHKVKIQRDPSGKILGACVAIPAEHLKNLADREYVNVKVMVHDGRLEATILSSDEPIIAEEESWN